MVWQGEASLFLAEEEVEQGLGRTRHEEGMSYA